MEGEQGKVLGQVRHAACGLRPSLPSGMPAPRPRARPAPPRSASLHSAVQCSAAPCLIASPAPFGRSLCRRQPPSRSSRGWMTETRLSAAPVFCTLPLSLSRSFSSSVAIIVACMPALGACARMCAVLQFFSTCVSLWWQLIAPAYATSSGVPLSADVASPPPPPCARTLCFSQEGEGWGEVADRTRGRPYAGDGAPQQPLAAPGDVHPER